MDDDGTGGGDGGGGDGGGGRVGVLSLVITTFVASTARGAGPALSVDEGTKLAPLGSRAPRARDILFFFSASFLLSPFFEWRARRANYGLARPRRRFDI